MFRLSELKLRARDFGIRKIDANVSGGRIEFAESARVDPAAIVRLIESEPANFALGGTRLLRIKGGFLDADDKLEYIDGLLDRIEFKERPVAQTA